MQSFAALLDGLVYTQSRNRKIALLAEYFRTTADPDRGWALAALTDGLPIRVPLRRMLSELTSRFVDPVLYKLSRDYVGDTAETAALLWPDNREVLTSSSAAPDAKQTDPPDFPQLLLPVTANVLPTKAPANDAPRTNVWSLDAIVRAMQTGTTSERTESLGHILDALDPSGRWAALKLIGGAPRVGVSARLARTAVAAAFGRDVSEIEGIWHALEPPYLDFFAWLEGASEKPDPGAKPVFRPVMLAHPIEEADWPKLSAADFAAEWKWDGIRVQVAAVGGDVKMFSRMGDDISIAFPEIRSAFARARCVVDGELLVMRDGAIAPFNDLQQRLNRKTVTAKMLREYPAHVRLYDLLFENGEDLRALPFVERRRHLEAWHARENTPLTDLSHLVPFDTFDDLNKLWSAARDDGVEGLMLKRRDSAYQAGRIKGQWFKWKRAALTLDCVLMYAQRGSGKRSSFYSDYTFGVWRPREPDLENGAVDADAGAIGDNGALELVPVGKAYSGFTDEELRQLDRWIRAHTIETFGPVRAVEPGIVFEVAFDAVQKSTRHKSGVAMRFPRIHRIRWDKPVAEADTLDTVKALVGKG